MSVCFISRRTLSVFKQIKDKLPIKPILFDIEMQKTLEHLSLISFQNEQTLKKVQQTIQSTDLIHQVNVDNLRPLYTLVETEVCPLRQTDTIADDKTLTTKQILANAANTYEEYLVAPMIGKRDSQTVEQMTTVVSDRLLFKFFNVKNRLESLLKLCRIHENPMWTGDDDCEEYYRFFGPYQSDIEELEKSISQIQSLIENLQLEKTENEDMKPIPDYPLCENGWTFNQIEQLEEEHPLNFMILKQIAQHTLDKYDEEQLSIESFNENIISTNMNTIDFNSSSMNNTKNLLDLPPELLLHILSFLSPFDLINNLAPTCQYLANLILTRVYSHLKLSKSIISIFDITQMLSYLPYLQSITFQNWQDEISILTWSIWFDRISNTTSNLQTITFQNILISPILICLIVEYFSRSLQTIVFNYQQNKAYEKFDLILSLFNDENLQLKHITASYQLGITNFGILQLIQNLNAIVELNLLYIEAINDETVKNLCDKHHSYLEILRIDGAQLTDLALDSIGQCRKLKSFMIEFCTNLTGCNFQIFQSFANLKELCLSKLTNIPLESFEILFNQKYIFEHLTILKLGECHMIDDDCVRSIIKMCPHLIDLTCTWAYSITDDSFNEIIIRCYRLRRLSLVGCHLIRGQILNDVPEKYLHQIEYLNFEHCNQIDDELLVELYRRKKSLIIFDYYGTRVEEND